MLDSLADNVTIALTIVTAAVLNLTRADCVDTDFTFDGERGCVARISAPFQLPTLDDVP
jgi:hypothetical protein